jgi:hypothetical protein
MYKRFHPYAREKMKRKRTYFNEIESTGRLTGSKKN